MDRINRRDVVYSTEFCELVAKTVPEKGDGPPYYSLSVPDYVTVLPVTTEGDIVCVKLFRPAVETESLELPSGVVEEDEDPMEAGHRELLEETGYRADKLEFLGSLNADTGRIDNTLWCYFAGDVKLEHSDPDREEGIERIILSQRELDRSIDNGEFNHALHLAVLFLAMKRGCYPKKTV